MGEDTSMSDYTCSEDEGASGRRLGAAGAACSEDAARQNKGGKPRSAGMTLRFRTGTTHKRPLAATSADEDAPAVAHKVASSSTRGRVRRPVGVYSFLKEAKDYLADGGDSEGEDPDPSYRPHGRMTSPKMASAKASDDGTPGALSRGTVDALAEEALKSVEKIKEEIKKSSHLKGTVWGQINRATKCVVEAVEGLRDITPEEEQRRLRADNARLTRELDIVRNELRAFKQAYVESQRKSAAAPREATGPQQPNFEEVLRCAMEEMKGQLLQSVGGMINARLQDLEMRLPPEPVMRPPLRADQRQPPPPRHKSRSGLVEGAMEVDGEAQPPQAPTPRAVKKAPKKGAAKRPTAPPPPPPSKGKQGAGQADATPPPPTAGTSGEGEAQTGTAGNSWSEVVRRKKRGNAAVAANSPPSAGTTRQIAPAPPKAVKIVAPKTAAIVVTLKKGATMTTAEGAMSDAKYTEVLAKARSSISLREFGLESVRIRTSMTGSKLMEVGGTTPEETADRLAAALVEAVGSWADITRPTKMAVLRITGLDDTVTTEEVAAQLASVGGCPPTSMKVGNIRPSFWGGGSALVKCPATAAKAVVKAGRVAIGWTMATVKAVEAQPLRCYKCMMLGHTRALCPAETENGRLCFRCGSEGHKSAECEAPCKCTVCATTGRPHSHVMGGAKCTPPSVKGKAPSSSRVPRTQPQPHGSRRAEEEEMQVS
ncbi:uncharacterized protein LOC123722320 [Papilio machaon]|uniref:uncharacterized protein LOC123722320 n=1 Tax=Papilio machaon TaxID=76193 RepID=UPI001E664CC0|nr:uncharacterized protein LOC123722320 [Papilio machaon]